MEELKDTVEITEEIQTTQPEVESEKTVYPEMPAALERSNALIDRGDDEDEDDDWDDEDNSKAAKQREKEELKAAKAAAKAAKQAEKEAAKQAKLAAKQKQAEEDDEDDEDDEDEPVVKPKKVKPVKKAKTAAIADEEDDEDDDWDYENDDDAPRRKPKKVKKVRPAAMVADEDDDEDEPVRVSRSSGGTSMTFVEFIKSRTFKCIYVLLAILLISGMFLTIMNGLLEVTAGEKLQRSIAKMYPNQEVTVYGKGDKKIDASEISPESYVTADVEIDNAVISEVYKIVFKSSGKENTHYLVTSKGLGGYDNGTVTCSVALEVANNSISGVYKVSIQSNVGQSFIDRVSDSALAEFTSLYAADIYYSQDMITGATVSKTKTAICNAVNGAIAYVNQNMLGKVEVNIFDGFTNPVAKMINTKLSTFTVEDDVVTYELVTGSYDMDGAFTLKIVVSNDTEPVITSFEIVKNGSTYDMDGSWYGDKMADVEALFEGKTLDFFTDMLGNDWAYKGNSLAAQLQSGATNSHYNVTYACAFALANYENCLNAEEATENE